MDSVGQFLINHHIPEPYRIPSGATHKDIQAKFNQWAKEDPSSYAAKIPEVKRIADTISTYEGFTIGMDDISPMKQERERMLSPYTKALQGATTDHEIKKILVDATNKGSDLAMSGQGSLVEMVHAGARGKPAQLMKNIVAPISARDSDGTPYPFLIKKSYAEGLSPAEYWTSAIEARNQVVEVKTSTAEPGDFGKQLFNALNTMVIAAKDCGTKNGIHLSLTDHNVLDRYLATDISNVGKRNTLVTSKLVDIAKRNGLRELMVRSPMTCEARNGVCQLCYGLSTTGRLHDIGMNVGTLAAQSLSEPLTQMALSSKHGGKLSLVKQEDTGALGVKKLLMKPKIFPNKAALSQIAGTVTKITSAAQGGKYVYVNTYEHYVPLTNQVIVKLGQVVQPGDALSDGLKDPREFTNLRGLGSGRSYMANALYNAYNPLDPDSGKRVGIPLDKRHIEVLVKKDMNHVVVDEHNDTFTRGDIVDYNKLKGYLSESTHEVPLSDAIGEYLGKEYLHYTVGTEITPHIIDTLRGRGITKVIISNRKIKFSPYVTNLRMIPLLKDNFIGRMSHSDIKRTGESADIHSYDPIHSFIRGIEFGEGPDGQY
jgi:DNA-directed RNA polymerase subunit beta'